MFGAGFISVAGGKKSEVRKLESGERGSRKVGFATKASPESQAIACQQYKVLQKLYRPIPQDTVKDSSLGSGSSRVPRQASCGVETRTVVSKLQPCAPAAPTMLTPGKREQEIQPSNYLWLSN